LNDEQQQQMLLAVDDACDDGRLSPKNAHRCGIYTFVCCSIVGGRDFGLFPKKTRISKH
jgi:hypothetical protein